MHSKPLTPREALRCDGSHPGQYRVIMQVIPRIFLFLFLVSMAQCHADNLLVFDKTDHDFGKIIESAGILHCRFVYHNVGSIPLKIVDVDAPCGCTEPGWSTDPILPGTHGAIEVGFQPGGYNGPVKKSIFVVTDPPGNPITLTITADVSPDTTLAVYRKPWLRIPTDSLHVGSILRGNAKHVSIRIRNGGTVPLVISAVDGPSACVAVHFPDTLKALETGAIELRVTPDSDSFRYVITVGSNDPESPRKPIVITGKVVDAAPLRVTDLRPEDALTMMQKAPGRITFLDVRTPSEYRAGHLKGAVNIDYKATDFRQKLLALPRDQVYVVYCEAGVRSRGAVEAMTEHGFTRIFHVPSGFRGWKDAGLPVEVE